MGEGRATLEQAVERHQARDFAGAESLYREVLADRPDDGDVRYLLGTALLQGGRFDEAISEFGLVIASRRELADAHNNLGVALKAVGRWQDAARAFQSALEANPEYDQALFNLGTLMQERRLHADAEKCFRHAIELRPTDATLHAALGDALRSQQRWSDSEVVYREALRLGATDLDVRVNLAYVLARQERLGDAADQYHRILAQEPAYHEVHNNLSYVYERQGKLDDAVAAASRAVGLFPRYAEGYNNLGTALRSLHRLDAACDAFRAALSHKQGFARAEFNLGTTLLLAGRWAEGWAGYEKRGETVDYEIRTPTGPRWNGQPLDGLRLLILADQGLGDALQFARFLPVAKSRSRATVIFESPPELRRLFDGAPGIDELLAEGAAFPAYDRWIPLESLPAVFGTTLETLPHDVPYLTAPPSPSAEIVARLDALDPAQKKIGFVWQGNPSQARDDVRSVPLSALRPLLMRADFAPVLLQTGDAGRTGVAALLAERPGIVDLGPSLTDFGETAAVMERLDLIVTVDTAAAHLAGALGRPTWTLLCHTPDWRWLLEQTDCPWYPTMRLFRQPQWGDWASVVAEIEAALDRLA